MLCDQPRLAASLIERCAMWERCPSSSPAGCDLLRECGRRFLGAYLDRRPSMAASAFVVETEQFAAMKIVSHLVAYVRGYGFDAGIVAAQLALASRVLDGGWEPPA